MLSTRVRPFFANATSCGGNSSWSVGDEWTHPTTLFRSRVETVLAIGQPFDIEFRKGKELGTKMIVAGAATFVKAIDSPV